MILRNNAQHQLPDDGPPAVLLVDRDQHLHPPPPRHLQLTHRQVNSFLILIILVHLLEVEGRGKGADMLFGQIPFECASFFASKGLPLLLKHVKSET